MESAAAASGWEQTLAAVATAALVAAASGLLGVWVGASLTTRREETARRHRFVERQVEDFYSQMVGVLQEIRAKSTLREEITSAAGVVWQQLCQERSGEALRHMSEEKGSEFQRIIQYDNRQLAEELLPAHRKMLEIFRDNYWLAEESTRAHFPDLLEFVEMWNRWMDRSIPPEVVDRIDRSESTLEPLYQDLEDQLRELRAKLASGKA